MELDELNYRSPVGFIDPSLMDGDNSYEEDKVNYSTLKDVKKILKEEMESIRYGIDLFDPISIVEDREVLAKNLLSNIESRKMAFDILNRVYEMVCSSINSIDELDNKN